MGWRAQDELDNAEKARNRVFISSLQPYERIRYKIWQYSGLGILICLLALFALFMISARSEPIEPHQIEVLDGDTIRVDGNIFRLVGFDAPESGLKAKCASENFLAVRATFRLRQIVAGGGLDLERVKCSCRTGTEGTRACNHGRFCGTLNARGQDVGEILIAERLAREYLCNRTSCPKRMSWC